MNDHVHIEVGLVEEGLAAHLTGVGMHLHLVVSEVVKGGERLVTVDAPNHGLRLHLGTWTVVGLEGGHQGEHSLALCTLVGRATAVHTLASEFLTVFSKPMPRLHLGMLRPDVVVHCVVASEGATAVVALHPGSIRVVDLHVADELVGSVEVLVTDHTSVRPVLGRQRRSQRKSLEVDKLGGYSPVTTRRPTHF